MIAEEGEMAARPAAPPWADLTQRLDPYGVQQLVRHLQAEHVRAAWHLAEARALVAEQPSAWVAVSRAEERLDVVAGIWHVAVHLAELAEQDRADHRAQLAQTRQLLVADQ